LQAVAQEMFDSGDESGYLVSGATEKHPAFTNSRRPSSALERELFLDAARAAASREGLYIEEDSGCLDLVAIDGNRLRRYRVKRGARTAAGAYQFVCGSRSRLLASEPESLYMEERWILGYFSADDHTVDEVIAAEVLGGTGEGPVRLRLGTIIHLAQTPPPGGFTSTNEDLDGFEGGEGNMGAA